MKAAGDRALQFCARPDPNTRLVLIFGDDEGVVSDASDQLVQKWTASESDACDLSRLQEDEIRRESGLLVERLSARPLFGGSEILRLRVTGETLTKIMVAVVKDVETGALPCENRLIVEAGQLGPKSELRKTFETSSSSMALHLYEDSAEDMLGYVSGTLSKAGVAIDDDALLAFCSELPGDRRLANSEIDKLTLYADELGRSVSIADVKSVSATEQSMGADIAADAALAGRTREALSAVSRYLETGGSAISALRTLHFRVLRALDAKASAKYLRPPVFAQERQDFDAMLSRWSDGELASVLTLLYQAEKSCKMAGAPTDAILVRAIQQISTRGR